MRSPARRLGSLMLAGLLLAAVMPAAHAAAADMADTDAAATAAERYVLDATNRRRTDSGLTKLRWDARLATLARSRAEYMARTGVFSHTQSGGTSVFDLMSEAGIRWYGGGEIIAWNLAATLRASGSAAVKGWTGSAPHKGIMLSKGYNYVAFGVATSPTTGRHYWAGVYLKGPDRTGASAKIRSVSKTALSDGRVRVTIRWSGADTKLQVLTSGLRYYQIEKRRDGGAWYRYGTTTSTSLSRRWSRGHVYEFRVRARDRAGNWGSWKTVTVRP